MEEGFSNFQLPCALLACKWIPFFKSILRAIIDTMGNSLGKWFSRGHQSSQVVNVMIQFSAPEQLTTWVPRHLNSLTSLSTTNKCDHKKVLRLHRQQNLALGPKHTPSTYVPLLKLPFPSPVFPLCKSCCYLLGKVGNLSRSLQNWLHCSTSFEFIRHLLQWWHFYSCLSGGLVENLESMENMRISNISKY